MVIVYKILSRGLMGENAILAEAINEDQHNILVEIIKVNHHSLRHHKVIKYCQAAELYLEEPEFSWWWSNLQKVPNTQGTWKWLHCKLT